jgi:hypothetical protein
MRAAEAASLIATGLPVATDSTARLRLAALSDRLGNWAQMLSIANGWLRKRVARGETLPDAIIRFETQLMKGGLSKFDPANETQRDKAIRLCVEASLEELDPAERDRFAELAVLPEDQDVPLEIILGLWAETGALDEDETDDLVVRLDGFSLLQDLDLGKRTLRLHDNIAWYLRRPCVHGPGIGQMLRWPMGPASHEKPLWLGIPDPPSAGRRTGRNRRSAADRLCVDQGQAARLRRRRPVRGLSAGKPRCGGPSGGPGHCPVGPCPCRQSARVVVADFRTPRPSRRCDREHAGTSGPRRS